MENEGPQLGQCTFSYHSFGAGVAFGHALSRWRRVFLGGDALSSATTSNMMPSSSMRTAARGSRAVGQCRDDRAEAAVPHWQGESWHYQIPGWKPCDEWGQGMVPVPQGNHRLRVGATRESPANSRCHTIEADRAGIVEKSWEGIPMWVGARRDSRTSSATRKPPTESRCHKGVTG